MGEITHDEARKAFVRLLCDGRVAVCADAKKVAEYMDQQQRAASVRVVRPLETVVHVSGRHSVPNVFDLQPGQSLAIIERPTP